jgi:SAM-dependent methyltransferase
MIEKFERRNNNEKQLRQKPYDDHFDWDAAFRNDSGFIMEHPEMEDALEVHNYLEQIGLSMADLKGKKLLDIGAGNVVFVKEAVRHGVDAYALDINAPDEQQAHGKHPTPLDEVPTFVKGSAYALPFQGDVFDIIVSQAGPLANFEWTQESQNNSSYTAIYEALRVLKPGGEIRFELKGVQEPDLEGRNAALENFLYTLRNDNRLELNEEIIGSWDQGNARGETLRLVIAKRMDL